MDNLDAPDIDESKITETFKKLLEEVCVLGGGLQRVRAVASKRDILALHLTRPSRSPCRTRATT